MKTDEKTNLAKRIYENIYSLCKARGTSVFQMSKDIGVPRTTLYDMEKGNSIIRVEALMKIAEHFGVPVDYLLK